MKQCYLSYKSVSRFSPSYFTGLEKKSNKVFINYVHEIFFVDIFTQKVIQSEDMAPTILFNMRLILLFFQTADFFHNVM